MRILFTMLGSEYSPLQGQVFGKNLYQTWSPQSPLSHWVHRLWQLQVPEGEHHYRSIPDNCVDLIVNLDDLDDAILVSPFTSPIVFPLSGPVRYFGIRFRPLGHHALLSDPIGEWSPADHQMSADHLIGGGLLRQILGSLCFDESFVQRYDRVSKTLNKCIKHPVIDPRVLTFVRHCYLAENDDRLDNFASRQLGMSDRQLRRISLQYLGLTPKSFYKVQRFQRTLQAWLTANDKLAWADWYFDQSHFSREFKQLTGITPGKFMTTSVLSHREQ